MEKQKHFNKNFTILSTANIISGVGNIIYNTTLTWWITNVTGTAKYVGYIMSASMIPVVILGPLSGVISDKFNKRKILIYSDIVSGIVTFFVCIILYIKKLNIPFLVICSFLLGASNTLFKPTVKSIIPEIVNNESLVKANSYLNGMFEIIRIISPLIAGLIIKIPYLGILGAFVINSISFFVSALLEIFIKYTNNTNKSKDKSILTPLKKGFSYIWKVRTLRIIIITVCITNFFLASFEVLIPLYVKNVIMGSSSYYSYLLSSFSIGGICISIILMKKNIETITMRLLGIPLILSGILLIIMSIITNKYLLLIIILLLGLNESLFNVMFFSFIQTSVKDEFLGRAFSIIFLLNMLLTPISYVCFGYLGDFLLNKIFIISGIGIILSTSPLIIIYNNQHIN